MQKIVNGKNKLISDTDLLLLSDKVVARYASAGTIPEKDKKDVKMAIVEKFLLKHDTIKKAFTGKAKVSTYCIAILNRMCCEIIRKELKHWKNSNEELQDVQDNSISDADKFTIKDEVNLLHRILLLFGDEQIKLRLFLAYFYGLTIQNIDIENYSLNENVDSIFKETGIKNKGEIFVQLAKVVNNAEQKELKADAIRMWLNKCIAKIILRLNSPFNRANYDKDTLQILFEYYYLDVFDTMEQIKKGA
ncbi:MAG: hypothetical protein PF517_01400 [Salinivirgaceae bacterium]|jgi:hypothetical protein|nr:hypothetical protein [Salinivirgaceae bacterium]